MQVKLLRVLQEKTYERIGSNKEMSADVRIIAATHQNLEELIKEGKFREDLFYRLNVFPIEMPPLRDRNDDVLLLARHFATQYAEELGRPVPRFADETLKVLKSYPWPGNVRELENLMQRLIVMTDSEVVEVPDLPTMMRFSVGRQVGADRTLAEVEAEYIHNVLASVNGNKTRAAQILGIDRKTLREKLKNHPLPSSP